MAFRAVLHLHALALIGCAQAVAAGTTIVVDLGSHPTLEAAANAESDVGWLDADATDDTVCTQCFAALELQHFLRRMTARPADFAAVDDGQTPAGDLLLVGGADSNSLTRSLAPSLGVDAGSVRRLGPEGYLLKSTVTNGRRVTLVAGGGRVGTLYAAYDLLYRLGCRWFAPGDLHQEVPHVEALVDLEASERPDYETRGFHAWEDRADPDFLLWMARNRLNYWCVEQSNRPLLRKLGIRMSGGAHTDQTHFLDPGTEYPYNHPRFENDEAKPPDPYPAGEHGGDDANADGKLSYFEAHPEWYAMVKGERIPGIRGESGTNYCTSNPDATREFVKNYVHGLSQGRYREADVVRLWTLDGGTWCQCEPCKATGIPTDRYLGLVNALANGVKDARKQGVINRPIIIRFLAYADVLHPPTRPLPADFDLDMCSATFFPIVRCYVHNIDDPACPKNAGYIKHLQGWATDLKRHYRGQLCIGEYYNVSGYKCLPICFMRTMANDIPYYYRMGARHFHYMHVVTANLGNKALTNYQMARQLWNTGTDCPSLLADYFARRYGAAAKPAFAFYQALDAAFANVSELKYGLARRLDRGAKELFPTWHLRYEQTDHLPSDGPTFLETSGWALRARLSLEAAKAVDTTPTIRKRLEEDERLFSYGELTLRYYHECVQAFHLERAGEHEPARTHFAQAKRIAEQLRQDETSTKNSSSHANARDAFAATYATGALTHLADMIGPADPAQIKPFDPAAQPLVLTGSDFDGGGALRFGYELYVFPGRVKVSDHGNYVYAKPNGVHSRITAWFKLPRLPEGGLSLKLVGLSRPLTDDDPSPADITVNDTSVHTGPVPFSVKELSPMDVHIPAAALQVGDNKIVIRSLAAEGPVGGRPWFGIDRAELRIEAPAQ